MKKTATIACCVFFLLSPGLWPQDLVAALCARRYRVDAATVLAFSPRALAVHTRDAAGGERAGTHPVAYEIRERNLYIRTTDEIGIAGVGLRAGRYLAVFGDGTLLLYAGDGREPALIASGDALAPGTPFSPGSGSSALEEGGCEYSAGRLGELVVGFPWAEGVNGPGIGESVRLGVYASQLVPKSLRLFILNGFVSYNRPDLFLKNNRVKILEVFEGSDKIAELSLADSTGLQAFDLSINGWREVRFVIKEVYRGDRYDDTCLTMLYPLVTSESREGLPSGPNE